MISNFVHSSTRITHTFSRAARGFTAQTTDSFRRLASSDCDTEPGEPCNPNQRYRQTSGQCNNLVFQSQPNGGFKLGAAFTAQGRFLFPDYDDSMQYFTIKP